MVKTVSFKDIQNDKRFMKTKYYNQIIWFNSLENSKKVSISDILSRVKEEHLENTIKLNFSISKYKSFKVLGRCDLDRHLHNSTIDKKDFMYLICDGQYKFLYISIGITSPLFWYEFTSKSKLIKEFDNIFETYNKKDYTVNMEKSISGHIGNQDIIPLSIHDVENHFLLNKKSEKLIWGSLWQDHPFRNKYLNNSLTFEQSIFFTGQAMRQENSEEFYTVSVRTLFSKSLVNVALVEDELLINIEYDPIETTQIKNINQIYNTKFNIDMPIDIICVLQDLPFKTASYLITERPLNEYNFFILDLLINSFCNKYFEENISTELQKIINDVNISEIIKEHATSSLKYVSDSLLIRKIVNEIDFEKILSVYFLQEKNSIDNLEEKIDEWIDSTLEIVLEKYNSLDNEYVLCILKNILKEKFD